MSQPNRSSHQDAQRITHTLTQAEQRTILRATARHPRDHLLISMALGTGLRLGEIVGLNVGDVFNGNGRPRARVRIRQEIAKPSVPTSVRQFPL